MVVRVKRAGAIDPGLSEGGGQVLQETIFSLKTNRKYFSGFLMLSQDFHVHSAYLHIYK